VTVIVEYMRFIKKTTPEFFRLSFSALLLVCVTGAAKAQSTYTFVNCNLPDTGQTVAKPSMPFGQDSDYQPSLSQPGYTIYNPVGVSSVTVDNRTGLMWVTNPVDAGMDFTYNWEGALYACKSLIGASGTYAGYSDWRLPNIRELMSIADYGITTPPNINGKYFLNTQAANYWSSTTYVPIPDNAWFVAFSDGVVNFVNKTLSSHYVRCVRGGP